MNDTLMDIRRDHNSRYTGLEEWLARRLEHCQLRSEDRYDLPLTHEEWERINWDIFTSAPNTKFRCMKSDESGVYEVIFNGVKLYTFYDERKMACCSFLPEGVVLDMFKPGNGDTDYSPWRDTRLAIARRYVGVEFPGVGEALPAPSTVPEMVKQGRTLSLPKSVVRQALAADTPTSPAPIPPPELPATEPLPWTARRDELRNQFADTLSSAQCRKVEAENYIATADLIIERAAENLKAIERMEKAIEAGNLNDNSALELLNSMFG